MADTTKWKGAPRRRAGLRSACKSVLVFVAAAALAVSLFPAAAFASFGDYTTSKPTEAPVLELGVEQTVSIEANGHAWVTFTPSKDGKYRFSDSSNSDTYGALYEVDPSNEGSLNLLEDDDDDGPGTNFAINWDLEAGSTYYLACSTYSDESGTTTVTVVEFDPYNIEHLHYGTGCSDFLVGTLTDIGALGVYVEPESGDDLTIGNGLKVVGYYAWDDDAGDYKPIGTNIPSALGEYLVEVESVAPYHGKLRFDFYIESSVDIDHFNANAENTGFWAGKQLSVADLGKVFIYPSGSSMKYKLDSKYYEFDGWLDDDENALSQAPSEPGDYYAVFKGKNGYKGDVLISIEIYDPKDIMNSVPLHNGEYVFSYLSDGIYIAYTGEPVSMTSLGIELKTPKTPGSSSMSPIGPMGPMMGSATDQEWAATLRPGVDYKVANWYASSGGSPIGPIVPMPIGPITPLESAPAECGSYVAEFAGISPFTGSGQIPFRIVMPTDVAGATVTGVEQVCYFDGSYTVPAPTVTALDGKQLVLGKDYSYTVRTTSNSEVPGGTVTEPGMYLIDITGMSPYTGEKIFPVYLIPESGRVDVTKEEITLEGIEDSYAYTGGAICPQPVLSYYGMKVPLVLGRDYEVSYRDNVTGPTATVTVTFKGSYKGTLSKTFKITGAPAAKPIPAPAAKKATSVAVNAKKVTAAVVAKAIKKAGTDVKTVKTITLGKKVKKIGKKAFAKCKKVTKLIVKTKKLKKAGVKGCLKGSKGKTVQVKVGSKKANKKFVKAYKKIFTKKVAGKKAKVK